MSHLISITLGGFIMIYIPKNLPKKYAAVLVYAITASKHDPIITTQELLLQMNMTNTQSHRKFINDTLQSLIRLDVISGTKLKSNKYELQMNEVDLKTNNYCAVDYYDINKIMNLDAKCNKLDLVDYYITLVSTINYKTHVGFTSIITLSKRCQMVIATISRYNRILKDNKIIFFVTSKKQGISNRYGLFRDKDEVIKAAKEVGIWY